MAETLLTKMKITAKDSCMGACTGLLTHEFMERLDAWNAWVHGCMDA